ncbi:MAG TPA: tetrahydrofolate dehydrogenase/cyclohydrolase catalytic domain-containing protein, partial [Polyangia bacterium]
MSAKILDGKALAARIKGELGQAVTALGARGVEPGLAVVLVGDDPASQIYVRNKTASCAQAGIRTFDHRLPATTSQAELLA